MTDLETLVRDALTDDRRRVPPPPDASGWVHAAARRQRRRNAVVGALVASVLTAAAGVVVVPMLNDVEASYVTGLPPADSGLLPWEPAGSLVEDPGVVTAAIKAWEAQSDDQPAGSVYVVAGANMNDTDVVVLQARTDSGARSVALLTAEQGASDGWVLRDVSALTSDAQVEALLLPSGTVPLDRNRVGADNPPSLILGPQWRSDRSSELGWQLLPAGAGFGAEPTWRPLERASGYAWWAPIGQVPPGLAPTTLVLDHGPEAKAEQAPVLEIGDSNDFSALVAADISFRVLRGDDVRPEALQGARDVAARLDLRGRVRVTVLGMSTGAVSVGRSSAISPVATSTMFAQFEAPELDRPQLVAYATTGGKVTCFSQRPVPAVDATSLPFVAMGCQVPVTGSRSGGVQGNLLMAHSFMDEPELKSPVLDISVTMLRTDGSSTTHELPGGGSGLVVTEDARAPVRRYVFTATETFDFTDLEPWVWPGGGASRP